MCLLAGLGIAASTGSGLLVVTLFYICLTAAYSLYIKRLLLVDVLVLAALYTTRVVAGHIVTSIPFSVWLSSFAFFLFLSLAFAKRAAELVKLSEGSRQSIPGRGYNVIDLQVITIAGICSGFLVAGSGPLHQQRCCQAALPPAGATIGGPAASVVLHRARLDHLQTWPAA